jgi:hypothetical protein
MSAPPRRWRAEEATMTTPAKITTILDLSDVTDPDEVTRLLLNPDREPRPMTPRELAAMAEYEAFRAAGKRGHSTEEVLAKARALFDR